MGFQGGGAGVAESFFQTFEVTFTGSGESDNGLTFGASIDLDEVNEQNNEDVSNSSNDGSANYAVFISGAFGTLTMGDTDSGMDWALSEAAGQVGSIDDVQTTHAGYVGGNYLDEAISDQILRYNNSFGAFGVAASVEIADENADTVDFGYSLGFSYDLDFAGGSAEFGIGYTDADSLGEVVAAAVAVELNSGFSFGAMIADGDVLTTASTADTHYQLSVGYEFGPFAIGANYGEFDGGATDNSGYAITGSYDLGGGATLHAGFGDSDGTRGAYDNTQQYSLGLAMSF